MELSDEKDDKRAPASSMAVIVKRVSGCLCHDMESAIIRVWAMMQTIQDKHTASRW